MKVNHKKPTAAGKSSYDLIDTATFFRELDLKAGITFLDVACGRGAYCLKALEFVKTAGTTGAYSAGTRRGRRDAGPIWIY